MQELSRTFNAALGTEILATKKIAVRIYTRRFVLKPRALEKHAHQKRASHE